MQRIKRTLIMLIVAAAVLSAAANREVLKKDIGAVPMIQQMGITVLDVRDMGSLYIVKGLSPARQQGGEIIPPSKFTFFVTHDKKYLVSGKVVDMANGQPVQFPIDPAVKKQYVFKYGKGPKDIYIFTDPECPYCKKFELKMPELAEKYTMHVYLFPLPFHQNAKAMSRWILDAKTDTEKADRLIAIAKGSEAYKEFKPAKAREEALDAIIEKQLQIGQDAGIRGTPTVLDDALQPLSWQEL